MPLTIKNRDARQIFMAQHGLAGPVHRKLTAESLCGIIDRIGFVQVDSINTVARAHHMILHARNRTYRPEQLDGLLVRERAMFENWTHDAAVIPTRFYPYWQARFPATEERLRKVWRKSRRPEFVDALEAVRARIAAEGPLMARDFAREVPAGKGGWWNWHPAKTALEFLWRTGELAISRREGFQKVYDLTPRVIPEQHRARIPGQAELVEWACMSALQRLGFASPGEIAAFWDIVSPAEAGKWCGAAPNLRRVRVEGAGTSDSRDLFALAEAVDSLSACEPPPKLMRVLSPFDPMIRNRERTRRLFGFDYRIEIFVPAAKRRYGYYVFPLLEGDRFVGRIDMKHNRQDNNALSVAGLWPEPGIRFGPTRMRSLEAALDRTRRFCGAERIDFADDYLRD